MASKRRTCMIFLILTTFLSVDSVFSAALPHTRQSSGVSKGFKLIANVTDPSKQFSVPIQDALLEGAHVGAGLNTAVLNITDQGQTFYLNGTTEDVSAGKTSILTDGGTPLGPYGIRISLNSSNDSTPIALSINGGIGTSGVTLTISDPRPGTMWYDGAEFIACDETLAYYGPSRHFAVVKALEVHQTSLTIPENCVSINLLPQCADLSDLPPGSLSSHEFANEVSCFEGVPGTK